MSTPINDGGPAFPEAGLSGLPNGDFIHGRSGMSLRDYFAANALAGLCANSHWIANTQENHGDALTALSMVVYELADAMLRAREVKA